MAYTFWVRDVIDGNTLAIDPSWVLNGHSGVLVRASGLRVPPVDDPLGNLARTQMMLLLLGCPIHITRVYGIQEGILECDISTQGRDLRTHFPKYANWDFSLTAVGQTEKAAS